jgi:hypothetical protein
MCLHFTLLNVWSGQEQEYPNSVEITLYLLFPDCDFTLYKWSFILRIDLLLAMISALSARVSDIILCGYMLVLFQYSVKYLVPMITSLQWVDKFASVQEEADNPV